MIEKLKVGGDGMKKTTRLLEIFTAVFLVMGFAQPALADYVGAVKADKKAVEEAFKAPGYSPYAGRNFPTMPGRCQTGTRRPRWDGPTVVPATGRCP